MECAFTELAPLIKIIIGSLVNGVGLLFTLVTLFILLVCPDLDPQLRDVLFSYQFSNLVGCSLTTYEAVSASCRSYQLGLVGISLILALSHFGMLLICEYNDLTTNPRVYVEPLKGNELSSTEFTLLFFTSSLRKVSALNVAQFFQEF